MSATYTIDSMAVDLGFVNFYWSKRNLGAENSTEGDPGNYYQFTTSMPAIYNNNTNWRIPEKPEVDTLIDKCTYSIESNGVKFARNNQYVLIPKSSFKNPLSLQSVYKNFSYFWTSTRYSTGFAYRFLGGKAVGIKQPYKTLSAGGTIEDYEPYSAKINSELPIRPVIDKVTLTYKVSESKNNTTSETFSSSVTVPMGTMVTLTATADECYRFVNWSDGNRENPRTIEVTKDMTLTAVFTIKTTNVKVTTDSNKGWVGLNVWK